MEKKTFMRSIRRSHNSFPSPSFSPQSSKNSNLPSSSTSPWIHLRSVLLVVSSSSSLSVPTDQWVTIKNDGKFVHCFSFQCNLIVGDLTEFSLSYFPVIFFFLFILCLCFLSSLIFGSRPGSICLILESSNVVFDFCEVILLLLKYSIFSSLKSRYFFLLPTCRIEHSITFHVLYMPHCKFAQRRL